MEELNKEEMMGTEGGACEVGRAKTGSNIEIHSKGNRITYLIFGRDVNISSVQIELTTNSTSGAGYTYVKQVADITPPFEGYAYVSNNKRILKWKIDFGKAQYSGRSFLRIQRLDAKITSIRLKWSSKSGEYKTKWFDLA